MYRDVYCNIDGWLYPLFQFCQSSTHIELLQYSVLSFSICFPCSGYVTHFLVSVINYNTYLQSDLSLSSRSILFKWTLIISTWNSHRYLKFRVQIRLISFPSQICSFMFEKQKAKINVYPSSFIHYSRLHTFPYTTLPSDQLFHVFPKNGLLFFCPKRGNAFSSSKNYIKLFLKCT